MQNRSQGSNAVRDNEELYWRGCATSPYGGLDVMIITAGVPNDHPNRQHLSPMRIMI